jgi:hypothetical protein
MLFVMLIIQKLKNNYSNRLYERFELRFYLKVSLTPPREMLIIICRILSLDRILV